MMPFWQICFCLLVLYLYTTQICYEKIKALVKNTHKLPSLLIEWDVLVSQGEVFCDSKK